LVEVFGYDVGDKGKQLMENTGSIWLIGSLGMRLTWAQWLDGTGGRVDEASFERYGMRRK
jgi:hypothetical protein